VTDLGEGWKIGGEEFVADMLRVTAQPMWVVDPDGLIRFANPAAVQALGYDRADELLGRPSHETIHYQHPDGQPYPASECPMLLPRKTGETVRSELDWFFRRDGSMFPVSYVSAPIRTAQGRGAVVAFTDIEQRLGAEEALRKREADLAEQQAALRRVAALVAGDAASAEVFAAVAREVGQVLQTPLVQLSRYEPDGSATVIGAWSERPHPFQAGTRWPLEGPTISTIVRETGRPARLDDLAGIPGTLAEAVRRTGIGPAAGAPIMVGGRVWGVMATGSTEGHELPPGIEHRLAEFTELVASAIANAQAREELRPLADEQAALRRVATLIAGEASPQEVFAAVAKEVARVLGVRAASVIRYNPGGKGTQEGLWGDGVPVAVGESFPLERNSASGLVWRTGTSATVDLAEVEGEIPAKLTAVGLGSAVAVPVIVEGILWGCVLVLANERSSFPDAIEDRLASFTELIATAVSNAQARQDLRRLAEEQAALRRVATLVAHGAQPEEIFALVAQEIARVTELEVVMVGRYDPDRTVTLTGAAGEHPFQPGTRWPLDGKSVSSQILDTGRPVSNDPYQRMTGTIAEAARSAGLRAGVGAPVIVDGQVWGNVTVGGTDRVPLPPDIERRLTGFTELIATAVSNAQARQDLRRFVDEQAALRQVATLVAEGADPQIVFDAVCEETGRLFGATTVNLAHFTPDGFNLTIAGWSLRGVHIPTATRLPLDGDTINTLVRHTAAPGRCDSYEHAHGKLATRLRQLGIRSEVGAPVVVDGEVWGALIAGTDEPEPLAPGTEHRLAGFAELIATAVSNATARAELVASRARIVTAGDEQRRRVVRDLHDGAQQRLVHALITLQLAHGEDDAGPKMAELVGDALEDTRRAIEELRELAHGLHPAVLTTRGLAAAVEELADRAPVPVRLDVPDQRYSSVVESAAYFIVAEALTNMAKYAQASTAQVTVIRTAKSLVVEVADDGVGGAMARPGSGLAGLLDRVAALAGKLSIDSPRGGGTCIRAELPLRSAGPETAGVPTRSLSDRATAAMAKPA
jgi:PAS domain S-box-containing protein